MKFHFKSKRILIISPQPWDHIHVSKHHYARELAKMGNQVVYLSPPGDAYSVQPSEFQNLCVAGYPGFIIGLRLLPHFLRIRLTKRVVHRLSQVIGYSFDVVWSFDNSVFYDLDAFDSHTLKICHIVDWNMNFQAKRSARSANICFGVTKVIVERLRRHNSESFFVQHGYAQKTREGNLTLPSDKLKIGYAGNLDLEYINWDLLCWAFQNFSDLDFYLAGPYSRALPSDKFKNVQALGQLNNSELSAFYEQVDILLLAYHHEKYPEQLANPHKMMEYLGTGKAVVATYTEEYDGLDMIYMAKDVDGWKKKLKTVIDQIERLNSAEFSKKRRAYASQHSYRNQIDKIEQLINEKQSHHISL